MRAVGILPVLLLLLPAPASTPISTAAETLPLRHAVAGNVVRIGDGGLATLTVDKAFRYVGGQRFVLLDIADAEQHAFVLADATGKIQRFYWVQFEQYLPGKEGRYDYGRDQAITLTGREWRAQVRRYSSAANPTSDQGHLYAMFAATGLHPPLPAIRTRLVHVTSADRRAELMIIYAEASSTDAAPTAEEIEAMIARAQAGLQIK